MKKLINLIALVMLVSTNILTPFTYAGDEIMENGVENIGEVVEISDEDAEIPEYEGKNHENITDDSGEVEQQNQGDKTSVDISLNTQGDVNEQNKEGDVEEADHSLPISNESEMVENSEEGNIGGEKENTDIETGSGMIETGDFLLESPIESQLYVLNSDPLECGSGYVLNADGTGCELIQVTFDANGGSFSDGENIKIVDTSLVEVHNKVYKYSHTENIDDNGVQQSDCGAGDNLNIRGTDRTSASSQAHVLTFSGSRKLKVTVTYGGGNELYDWVSVWAGNYPNYTAANNYSTAISFDGKQKLGGGNHLSESNTKTATINGDTVTFSFKNDSGSYGDGYGYYAVVEGEGNTLEGYECTYNITTPKREGYFFMGWYTDTDFTQRFDINTSECLPVNTTVYAKWYYPQPKDIILEATATEPNQTLKINKYFTNAYIVQRGDDSIENLTQNTMHRYSTAGTYNIVLSLSGADRWKFRQEYTNTQFVPKDGTSMSDVKIVYMPSLADGFGNSETDVGGHFFDKFNYVGAITSLPEGSFDTSHIAIAGSSFFNNFNHLGAITSLPEGSFNLSNIERADMFFFYEFNVGGALIYLPDSFTISSKGVQSYQGYYNAFNSNNYILNRNISELLSGVTVPSSDRNTFSDNQPGRCGVSANWLSTTANACHIIYEANGRAENVTGWYDADTTGIEAGTNIENPTGTGFYIKGWYSSPEGGNKINTIVFPEMNGIVLYAHYDCVTGYTLNQGGNNCELVSSKFDANGGKFENGNDIYVINPSINKITSDEVRYAHTPNVYDNGVASGDYDYDSYWRENKIVTITGAKKIHIEVIYGGEQYYDYVVLRKGNHPDYDDNNHYDYIDSSESGMLGVDEIDELRNAEFYVDGDTVTFFFISDGSDTYNGYGYYAIITEEPEYEVLYGTGVFNNIPEPTRNGYKFLGWYHVDGNGIEKKFSPEDVTIDKNYSIYAKREKSQSSSGSSGGGGGGGGGGGSSTKPGTSKDETLSDTSSQEMQDNTKDVQDFSTDPQNNEDSQQILTPLDGSSDGEQIDSPQGGKNSETRGGGTQTYSTEFQQAYEFAHENGITTKNTIESAQMNGKLTRIAMAKMLSQYAINVLGKTPDTSKTKNFNDVSNERDSNYDNGVTLAYQLGIMGQNMSNNNFRPDDEVTRAEFVTALSRLLYNTPDGEYKSTSKYYTHHMEKLEKEGIITNVDPKMKERRGYVMIMLMRSAE